MKKYFLPMAAVVLALGLVVVLTYIIAQAQGEDGLPRPGTGPTSEEALDSAESQGLVEEESLAPDVGDSDLRIAGSVLRPRDSDVGWLQGGDGGCIYASSGSTIVWWNTPIYLPEGSKVRQYRMFYNDTNAANNCRAFFTVYDLYGNLVEEWETLSNGSLGENFDVSEVFTHTVDYSKYSYVINWQPNELGSDMQLCGFRILYDPPPSAIFLPMIRRSP